MPHTFFATVFYGQMEEEKLARNYNDKLEMIGKDKSGLYLFLIGILWLVKRQRIDHSY